jgi:hypothetical protein
VFEVLMEADLGRREVDWYRVARPLLGAIAVAPLSLTVVPTGGNNLALQALGAGVGVVLGCACHLFVLVRSDPTERKSGWALSRAGFAYAARWAIIFAAGLGFAYGSQHVFAASVGRILATHQLGATGLTNAWSFMARSSGLARSAVLAGRGVAAHAQRPAHQRPTHQLQEA